AQGMGRAGPPLIHQDQVAGSVQTFERTEQRAQRLQSGLAGSAGEKKKRIGRRSTRQGRYDGKLEIDLPPLGPAAIFRDAQGAALGGKTASFQAAGSERHPPLGSGSLAGGAGGGEQRDEDA